MNGSNEKERAGEAKPDRADGREPRRRCFSDASPCPHQIATKSYKAADIIIAVKEQKEDGQERKEPPEEKPSLVETELEDEMSSRRRARLGELISQKRGKDNNM